MILLIDNYDSFTYNLYQYIGEINPSITVRRNDEITVDEVKNLNPSHIIISPGPGFPRDAGVSIPLIRAYSKTYPVLGICLGHQAICEAFGGRIVHAKTLLHGKQSDIHIANGSPVFLGLPPMLQAGRYHSLIAEKESLPNELLVIAEDGEGEVMAVKHQDANVFGLQFHPESVLTPHGKTIIRNFLEVTGA